MPEQPEHRGEPMTDTPEPRMTESEKWIRDDHTKTTYSPLPSGRPECTTCDVPWPCHYIAALDAKDAESARLHDVIARMDRELEGYIEQVARLCEELEARNE